MAVVEAPARRTPARRRGRPSRGRLHELPPRAGRGHRVRVDVRRDGDPARRLHRSGLHRPLGAVGQHLPAGSPPRRSAARSSAASSRPAGRPDRPPADLPGLDPLVRALHGAHRARVGAGIAVGVPLPRRHRARRACSSSTLDARRVPAAARRGRFLVFLDFFWPVGLLLATGLSWVFLVQVGGDWGWRYLFLAAAFPAFLAFVARLTLPESPYYLVRNGRRREAATCSRRSPGGPSIPTRSRSRSRRGARCASSSREAPRHLDDDRARLDRPQHLLLRAVPLASVRLQDREQFSIDVYLAARAERALPVPRLLRVDVARGADRPQADPGLFLFLGGVSAYAFASPTRRPRSRPRSSSSASSTSARGVRSTRTRPSSSPPGCARARSEWSRASARAPRSAARTSSAR